MSVLKKALGKDWDRLPSVIQHHYNIPVASKTCLKGNMEIGYPTFLWPLINLIHLCGGLVSKRGKCVETLVEKTISAQNETLNWKRTLTYLDGRKDFFYSQMVYLDNHELIETVLFGFGLRLRVTVNNGNLVYRSNGYIWQYGKLQLTFPDWLVLGEATIVEHAISDKRFRLDFYIKHPLWGRCYWYHGIFQHCE